MANLGRVVTVALGQAGVDGLAYTGLRVSFRVEQSLGGTPNRATIRLYNVNPVSLQVLDGPLPSVSLLAGYRDSLAPEAPAVPATLFRGDVIDYQVSKEGVDRVLEIEAKDGGRAWQQGRVDLTFSASIAMSAVIRMIAAQQMLPVGFVQLVPDVVLPHGGVFEGPFRSVMDRIAESGGAKWTIDSGILHVVPNGVPRPGIAPIFSTLLGTVYRVKKAEKRKIEILAPLDAGVRPGSLFIVQAVLPTPSGAFVAERVVHHGDSGFDTPFYSEILGSPPGPA